MAHSDYSGDWAQRFAPSIEVLQALANEAYAQLPETFRSYCGALKIVVVEFPDEQLFEDMGLDTPFDLLALFEGERIGERFQFHTHEDMNIISLFRRAILDYWAENEETLGDILAHVLRREIGQHFGLSDEIIEK